MMNQTIYDRWLTLDSDTTAELASIQDKTEIDDRFYKELEFGTGGLRGLMGAGINRINRYTIKKTTAGLADYLLSKQNQTTPSVVIAYDTRNHSSIFSQTAASVFSKKGIKVYLFKDPTPTPILSFAVRYLNATAGVVITASHNPKEYNGYKVYNEHGVQLVPAETDEVSACINKVEMDDIFSNDNSESTGTDKLWEDIEESVVEAFLEKVAEQSLHKNGNLSIVYTPLHGTGYYPIKKALNQFHLSIVQSQATFDGNFPTVKSPNPEESSALKLAIEQAKTENADLVIGTDPDCDRIGVAVRHGKDYQLLSGNQIGALLVEFILTHKQISHKSTLVKTIVTNELGATIAKKKGVQIVETLTGFKYIGEQMVKFEESDDREFLIGYEESFGFLVGTHARDKDAVVSALLISEMAAHYKKFNRTIVDQLNTLYEIHGYYLDALDSYKLQGKDGAALIQEMMFKARKSGKQLLPSIVKVLDYNEGIDDLPRADVLKVFLDCGSWIAIRPSGTEPKIKLYYSIRETNQDSANQKLAYIQSELKAKLGLL